MKSLGSLLVSILVGIVVIWLLVKLVFVTFKLLGILIGLGIAVAVYFAVRKRLPEPRP